MVALSQTLLSPTIAAINAAVEAAEHRDFDMVVRGSSIGHPCERHLWLKFRWAHHPEEFDGRKLRLFHTGHVEEARMVAWLRMAGVHVEAVDPATGEQWEVAALDGHFKGHLDGIATGLLEAPQTPHLLECKTHNAKSFEQLKRHGVAASKPEHVAQMQVYMHLQGLTRAFYLAKHKDSDELYSERVRYDATQAITLLAKAERVKNAARPLPRISDDPTYFLCKAFNCPSYDICHGPAFALRNCRTCLQSSPIDGGDARWICERDSRELSVADQRAGCGHHLFIPELVPGDQVDAAQDGSSVTYAMPDGSTWIDGRAAA